MKQSSWSIRPLTSVGPFEFGSSQKEIRRLVGKANCSIKKSLFSKGVTDDYGDYHVHYSKENGLAAVEVFSGIEVELAGKVVFPGTVAAANKLIHDFEFKSGSYISKEYSIGLYAPEGDAIETILIGCRDYYAGEV